MKTIIYSALTAAIVVVIALNVPVQYLSFDYWFSTPKAGTTLTTISGSSVVANFPTIYNANNTALNAGKFELSDWYSTTSAKQITTLASLSSIGTIVTGVWNGTKLDVAYGGTGSSTLAQYSVLLGSSTNPVGIVQGLGSSGQVLTSNGVGFPPSWQSTVIDQSLAYTWTGIHLFKNEVTMASSSIGQINVGILTATSTTATSTFQRLLAVQNASTTNLQVSGTCEGCTGPTIVSGTQSFDTTSGNNTTKSVSCTAPKKVVGGGFSGIPETGTNGSVEYPLMNNYPSAADTWTVQVHCNTTSSCAAGTLTVYAICANP